MDLDVALEFQKALRRAGVAQRRYVRLKTNSPADRHNAMSLWMAVLHDLCYFTELKAAGVTRIPAL
ncbi:MAG TPA: hypothetical protein VFD71_05000 [Planctomycetota bacterium]|jgi:hypothetical protein|nr:hypothetical protein [Planctomycetota bacterium]